MKTTVFLVMAACGCLDAQNVAFQQAGAMAIGGPVTTASLGPVIMSPTVTGSPYSGTETRHSLQVLGDGTRIERTETTQVARDISGRTRREDEHTISIIDPVSGNNYVLNKTRKIANRMPSPGGQAKMDNLRGLATAVVNGGPVSSPPPGAAGSGTPVQVVAAGGGFANVTESMPERGHHVLENLGYEVINNVPAKGTRTTLTIPSGLIGNDRPIQVVDERWYSDVLQTVVKTSNSDPRFGTTDFELTDISQSEPEASLFQVPPGYTVIEPQTLQERFH